jgi:hypothetical protein
VLIAVSTPRIQSSKVLLSVAPRHGGQEMQIRAKSPAISSANAEKRTFEQLAAVLVLLLMRPSSIMLSRRHGR